MINIIKMPFQRPMQCANGVVIGKKMAKNKSNVICFFADVLVQWEIVGDMIGVWGMKLLVSRVEKYLPKKIRLNGLQLIKIIRGIKKHKFKSPHVSHLPPPVRRQQHLHGHHE